MGGVLGVAGTRRRLALFSSRLLHRPCLDRSAVMRRLLSVFLAVLIGFSLLPGVAGAQTHSGPPGGLRSRRERVGSGGSAPNRSVRLAGNRPIPTINGSTLGLRAVSGSLDASLWPDQVRQIEFQVAGFGERSLPAEPEFLESGKMLCSLFKKPGGGRWGPWMISDHTDYVYVIGMARLKLSRLHYDQ